MSGGNFGGNFSCPISQPLMLHGSPDAFVVADGATKPQNTAVKTSNLPLILETSECYGARNAVN